MDPGVVLCRTSQVGDFATIREVGILCDHVFSIGSTKSDELSEYEDKYDLISLLQFF